MKPKAFPPASRPSGVEALCHRDLGGTGKPALILLHGLLGSSRNWQTVGKDLASSFHVLAVDLRNHGASFQAAPMSWNLLVEDVLHWLDTRSLSRVTLLGHSLGGKVAMRLACRKPERIERLVVVDIAPKDYHSRAHRAEFAAMTELDLATLDSRATAELRLEARVPDQAMRKFLTTNLERTESGQWRWAIPLGALTAALPELESNSLDPADRFPGPAVFILGGKSRYVVAEDHGTIQRHFPQVCFQVLVGAGHNPHIETREAFVRTVLSLS